MPDLNMEMEIFSVLTEIKEQAEQTNQHLTDLLDQQRTASDLLETIVSMMEAKQSNIKS